MRSSLFLSSFVCLVWSCGGAVPDPTVPHILWTYRISPPHAGRSRSFETPAIAQDGTIYVGGALADKSNTAVLYAVSSDGSLREELAGTVGDHRGAPPVWPVVGPDGSVAYAVDEDGGLYALRLDGDDTFRKMPEEAFSHLRDTAKPRLSGPIIAGERGAIYVGGTGRLHVLFIESRSTPLSHSVDCGDHVTAGVNPKGDVYCLSNGWPKWRDSLGKSIGKAAATQNGIPPVYGSRSGYWARRGGRRVEGSGFAHNLDAYIVGAPRIGQDETVYYVTARKIFAMNRDATPKWEFGDGEGFYTEVALSQDSVYITETMGYIIAIGPNGDESWRIKLGEHCSTPAIASDGTIYATCKDGLLYAVGPPV